MAHRQSSETGRADRVSLRGGQSRNEARSEQAVETKAPVEGVARLVAAMEPGRKYSPGEIESKMGINRHRVHALLGQALDSGVIRASGKARGNQFWVPTAEELAAE